LSFPNKTGGSILNPGVRPREAWAWAMFDFANSGYTTVVITAVFNAYFVRVVAGDAPWATLAWTATLAVSYLLLIVLGPLLGAFADLRARKKRLLALSTLGCVTFTWALSLAGPGDLAVAVVALVLSNFFFGAGENLIAAFLPELAGENHRGKLSGWGWGLGYVGGLTTLGLCLLYIQWARGQGHRSEDFVPVTLLITGALFLLAALPTLLLLRERAIPQAPTATGLVGQTASRLARTWREASRYLDFRRLLGCIALYQAGVAAVIALAAIYAQEVLDFGVEDSLRLILVVNLSAVPGSVALGHLQDRIGHVPALALTLVGWLAAIGWIWGAEGTVAFWFAANLAGICLGASQSIGRAFVSILVPASRLAEFFGLWGLAARVAAILGPLTYGLVTWLTAGDHRLALLTAGLYFLLGLAVLATIDTTRGRRAALAADDRHQQAEEASDGTGCIED
jgi:UMF1 family MFS transporter